VKTVIDDPDISLLPLGCIGADALIGLVKSLWALENQHEHMRGYPQHMPCLRRIESTDGEIIAHVCSGPSIGGSWHKLIYNQKIKSWSLALDK
jgi:hypothetical protein